MRIEAPRKLFTVDEYYRMAETGILTENDRVELIEGEIVELSPIGARHLGCVNRATDTFIAAFRGKVVVSPQNPLRLSRYTEPQPDLVLLQWRADYYASKTPAAGDALLVLEVSDTSLRYDREVKLPLYAKAGIPEVWIANLAENLLLVCRDLSGINYATRLALQAGDTVSVTAFPDAVFKVEDLLV